jgi:hypothetical protein
LSALVEEVESGAACDEEEGDVAAAPPAGREGDGLVSGFPGVSIELRVDWKERCWESGAADPAEGRAARMGCREQKEGASSDDCQPSFSATTPPLARAGSSSAPFSSDSPDLADS